MYGWQRKEVVNIYYKYTYGLLIKSFWRTYKCAFGLLSKVAPAYLVSSPRPT